MIEWGVHGKQPSIFLMQTIIPFRLIEHHFGGIVNSIDGRCIESGLERPRHRSAIDTNEAETNRV
jgi:hypothetical protein